MTAENFYGLVLAATLVVAAFSLDRDRIAAGLCACLLVIQWALYVSPWHGWGFHAWNHLYGDGTLDNATAWAFQDAAISILILSVWIMTCRDWVLFIWAIVIAEMGFEVAYARGGDDLWWLVKTALDSLFMLSCVVIWSIGGAGVIRINFRPRLQRRNMDHSLSRKKEES